MEMNRREFLGTSAGAASILGVQIPRRAPPRARELHWNVLPVRNQCSLRESGLGYRAALKDVARPAWDVCTLLIIPAVLDIPLETMQYIAKVIRRGSTVIIESGAGFTDHLNFRRHRRAMREYFQLDIHAPVDLWGEADQSGAPRVPYIDYTWPYPAKIRDFSRVVPVGDQRGEIIAWAGDLPVGLRRPLERGTLIYLGSPLGPVLRAGDAEARRWLHTIASTPPQP